MCLVDAKMHNKIIEEEISAAAFNKVEKTLEVTTFFVVRLITIFTQLKYREVYVRSVCTSVQYLSRYIS